MNHVRRRMLWMLDNVRFFISREAISFVRAARPNTIRSAAPAVAAMVLWLGTVPAAPAAGNSARATAPTTDVRVLSSTTSSVVLEYTPHFTHTDTMIVDGRTFVRFNIAEGRATTAPEDHGIPDLRQRAIPLAFPTAGSAALRVLAADYEDRRGIDVLPVAQIRFHEGMPDGATYATDKDAYGRAGFAPASVASVTSPAAVRSLLIGNVMVAPVQYDPVARVARVYSRVVVEITFASGPTQAVEEADVALLSKGVANVPTLTSMPRATRTLGKTALVSSVLASGDWYRLAVKEEGMYRLDAGALSAMGINTSTLDPRTIRIYGNGGKELSEGPGDLHPDDLVENAIYVEGESDGQFGSSDYVLFYGRSPRGWTYSSSRKTWNHYINHYTETNYYWLTIGGTRGKRMTDQPSSTLAPSVVVEKFTDLVAIEEEKVNKLSSGKDWYGQSISGPSGSITHLSSLPGLVPNDVINYRFTLVAHDETTPNFTVREGTTVLGRYYLPPSSEASYQYANAGTYEASASSSLSSGSSQLSVSFASGSTSSEGWVDWVEIMYPRMLWGVSNVLHFRSQDATGIAEYLLQQFTARPMIFNVTDPANVRLISGVTGSYSFRDTLQPGTVKEYWATSAGAWKTVDGAQKMPNQDLRGYASGADFIILTSEDFRSVAERIKTFREQAANGGLKTIVVDVANVYNEFGGGQPDITAIRDYLKYAYTNWTPRPTFVLFLGGASYDYKGILGTKSSYVPTWQSVESRHEISSYATDDYFAKFSQSNVPSLVLGRISARTVREANTVVDKIVRYQPQGADDGWKMRILYVADDSWTNDGGEESDGTMHSDDAETLSGPGFTPEEFEKKKIYIAEYPTVFTGLGRRKPGAAQDIIDQVNQGVLIVNYSGHGNPKVWAHENVFDVATSIPPMVNANRLALFVLATCNFSQFDDPRNYTGSELLLNKADGGAIGVISASRKVYAVSNAELNQGTYQQMFLRDAYGRLLVDRPSTGLFRFKVLGGNSVNDQKYFYMGDPTTQLDYPRSYALIDSINGERVDSVAGAVRTSPIVMKALGRVTVSGTIRDAANRIDTSFSGVAQLRVNDASRTQLIVNFYPGRNWSYTSTGGTVYRGENSVAKGRFRATFIVPKDISYADTTGRGRLVAYFSGAGVDGAGFTGLVRISGTDTMAANDGSGPTMHIYLNSRSFRPGDVVTEAPTLLVDLRDSNGVNTSTAGIGHRIEAWINNGTQSKDLTEHYTSTLDDFRAGTVEYPLTGLPSGKNTLRVRAWDSQNNSSVAETYFEVASSAQLSISDVFNYPNPFASETQFTFRQNLNEAVDVEVKIYTLAGRLIQSLHAIAPGDPMVRVPWDGRDRDGDTIANGVYLYKLVVRTTDGRFSSEALGKMTVLR
jgi:hypothetical protein